MPTHDSPWHETRQGYFLSLHHVNNSFRGSAKNSNQSSEAVDPQGDTHRSLQFSRDTDLRLSDAEANTKVP
jgi:hypothetical protein